jgi:hypothetical protein
MITNRDAALFSYLAYSPPTANTVELPEEWQREQQFETINDPETGFGARVFYDSITVPSQLFARCAVAVIT